MRLLVSGLAFAAALLSTSPLHAAGLTGKWRGSYSCIQGHTGLLLTITADTDETFRGEFAFFALPDNPAVPSGSYRVEGSLNPKSREVSVRGIAWIQRPSNYGMVDLRGILSEDGRAIEGKVQFSGCTSFRLEAESGTHQPTKRKGG